MKFIISSAAFLALSRADETTESGEITERKFNSIVSMAYSQINTSWDRKTFENKINKYGCHCFPNGSKAAGGTGPAVNSVDSACKQLYKCHKCVQLTFGDNAVDVDQGRYTWGINDDGSLNCEKNNKNASRKALCECDKAYAENMKLVWSDDSYNDFYWLANKHSKKNPTFVYDDTCVSAGNGDGNGADTCCGIDFPKMEPYYSGDRGCCQETVYNKFTSECCSDGSVGSIGSC